MSSTAHGTTPYYFVPHPSRHPVMAAIGLFFVILGAGQWVNGADWGKYSLFFGLIWWLTVLYQWFSEAISESESGQYGRKIDLSFRWSMTWFIFSEVMFFGAFFTASHQEFQLGLEDPALAWISASTKKAPFGAFFIHQSRFTSSKPGCTSPTKPRPQSASTKLHLQNQSDGPR